MGFLGLKTLLVVGDGGGEGLLVLSSGVVAFGGAPSLAAASAGATLLLSLVLEQV